MTPSGQRHARWLCACDCGVEKIVIGFNLRTGGTKSCGCTRPKGVVIGYYSAHDRVERARGLAKTHRCVGCGGQGREWSYNYDDPDELFDEKSRPYSLSPSFYSPRCVPCHRNFDRAVRAGT